MKEEVKTSAPPFNAQCVKCPCCGYTNFMGAKHSPSDEVTCSSCTVWFKIGGK